MKKRTLLTAVALATASLLWTGATGAGSGALAAADRIIRIHSNATQENFVDVAPAGPSLGDELVLHDDWTDPNGALVGHDGVTCTVTSLEQNGDTEFLCLLTGHLDQGDITVQGLFLEPAVEPPPATAVLAVTGGTGAYAAARGYLVYQEVSEEESHLTFHLLAG